MKFKPSFPFLIKLLTNIVLLGFATTALLVGYLALSLPEVTGISEFTPPILSRILSRDGQVLLEIGMEKRDLTPFSEIPQKVIDAFLVAEDKNFYTHQGVDYLGILRAFWANLKAGRVVQGGSTITQQVAKQLYLSERRSIARKIKDMLLALEMEKKFTKNEILYLYLNQVYLGGGYYGVTEAFRGYFEKELTEATTAECALIAGLLVAPSSYSPYVNPEYAKFRQNYVLSRLLGTKKISFQDYQMAQQEVLKFRIKKPAPLKGGHFTDWVRQRVEKIVGKKNLWENGFNIVTTIDWELQKKAEDYVRQGVKAIDKRQGYKGALRHLSSEPEILDFLRQQRSKTYKKNSHYFLLKPMLDPFNQKESMVKEYELAFDEAHFLRIQQYDLEVLELNKKNKGYHKRYPGNPDFFNDPFRAFIEPSKVYEAVVLHTNNLHQAIYVSIGGIKGVIPHQQFRWARERVISEKRNYIPLIDHPSDILTRGDVILVKVLHPNQTLYQLISPSAQQQLKDPQLIAHYHAQRFLKLALDQESDVEGALVAIHPESGEILSLVGGVNFAKSQFNRVTQSLRQPGSSFKPLLYASALENGFRPNDILIDSPETLGSVNSSLSWKPRNYDGTFKGPITFRRSLESSRNVTTIKLASQIGVKKIIDFAHRIGFKADLQSDLSLALGSVSTTLMSLTSSYAIFPNGGMRIYPQILLGITDRFGTEYAIEDFEPYQRPPPDLELPIAQTPTTTGERPEPVNKPTTDNDLEHFEQAAEDKPDVNEFLTDLHGNYVYDQRLAYIMTNLLKGVIQNGTGRGAKSVGSFIGGKTGTTNNYIDALFLGVSSNLTLGVWTGFDDNKTLGWGETGAKAALPIWKKYMTSYLDKYGEYDFKTPPGIINVRIHGTTGKLAKSSDTKTIMEAFVVGTEPGNEQQEQLNKDLHMEDIKNSLMEEEEYFDNQ